jgi:hypothetical protein
MTMRWRQGLLAGACLVWVAQGGQAATVKTSTDAQIKGSSKNASKPASKRMTN